MLVGILGTAFNPLNAEVPGAWTQVARGKVRTDVLVSGRNKGYRNNKTTTSPIIQYHYEQIGHWLKL